MGRVCTALLANAVEAPLANPKLLLTLGRGQATPIALLAIASHFFKNLSEQLFGSFANMRQGCTRCNRLWCFFIRKLFQATFSRSRGLGTIIGKDIWFHGFF